MRLRMLEYILIVWVSKHVWLICMTFLVMHETFKFVKWHVLTKCLFLVCFALICEYGLILSTYGVLTPFCSFSQTFKVPIVEGSFETTWRRLGYSLSSKWVGPHFLRLMPISCLWSYFVFLRLLCSFTFIWVWLV